MQNNKLALSLEETDVMGFLHEIFLSFKDTAASKNMDFRFQPSVASYKMFIDKGNLDKVVYNLLSNAFKYTPSNGKVTLSAIVDEHKKCLEISVCLWAIRRSSIYSDISYLPCTFRCTDYCV